MILCIDIGNTHLYGGLYRQETLLVQFRYPSSNSMTSDQLGVFLKMVLRENDLDPQEVKQIAICSVVPALNYTIRAAFLKYFTLDPFFLTYDKITSLNIDYAHPEEIGTDRLSNVLAASHLFPDENIIAIDFGTATTFDALDRRRTYLGGMIMPGLSIAMKALSENTAKLSPVNIVKPQIVIGQNTTTSIQSGLYYSHLGAAREIINRIADSFTDKPPIIVGTGGFAHLFEDEHLFTTLIPELVLTGLYLSVKTSEI
ncbi:MAG: type III pantothenate kinase [Gammaproteobacteria bacterium]|nr:type III pantothenate kinase [Gammaproteobacteria bacterium]